MNPKTIQQTYSRKRASLGTISLNLLHYSNPWVVAAWSFFFPGFGHMLLGEYTQGWIMFIWEVFVNVHANFNQAILFAVTGRFQASITLLRADGYYWILLYGTVFCYAVFGSYYLAIEENNVYTLAFAEDVPIEIFRISAFQFNFFNKRNPMMAAAWSLFMPGLGGLFARRIASYVFELAWWLVIVYYSHLLPSLIYSFTGHFEEATTTLNAEWMMFVPSLYSFTFYNAYCSVAEQNKMFDQQQATYLKTVYQNPTFPFRLQKEGTNMRIISTFDHNLYLEKAIVSVEQQGVPKQQIFAVPMNRNVESATFSLDTIHRSDGKAIMDVPALAAALGCAFGTLYGFVLHWGPVLWGLIGFFGGLAIGFAVKWMSIQMVSRREQKHSKTEVVLMIDCNPELGRQIEHILWHNHAFAIAKVDTISD